MKIDRIEMSHLELPYVHFFETSFGREYVRSFIILKVFAGGVCGWGEVVAERAPLYSAETTETAWHVLKDFLIPMVFEESIGGPDVFYGAAKRFRGHPMAKAGLELALWDLKAKEEGVPLSKLYGGVRTEVEAGVSCGIEDSIPELLVMIGNYLDQGYRRIKIKIKPGWDVNACEAVRNQFPDILLQVDANGAYTLGDKEHLKRLDSFNLLLIEQPFRPYDLWDHSKLQREMNTPLCLDESILSEDTARAAVEMGSCRIINIKVGRVGGVVETRKIHDYCREKGVPVWCGGMLESGIGRGHNLHIASLPNFTLPHDISASKRYYREDLIEPPVELFSPGKIRVPTGPGIGVSPVEDRVERATLRREVFRG
jgi:O-succinylbenzoate synthase